MITDIEVKMMQYLLHKSDFYLSREFICSLTLFYTALKQRGISVDV